MTEEESECLTRQDMQNLVCENDDQSGAYCQDRNLISQEYVQFRDQTKAFYD